MTTLATGTTSIPGPRAFPVLNQTLKSVAFMREPILYMRNLYETYGPIVNTARDDGIALFVFGPEYNHLLLSNPTLFHTNDLTSNVQRVPADSAWARLIMGLPAMNGAQHQQHRKLMLPAFHKKRVESYRETMLALAERQLAGWRVGEVRDMLREARQLTMAVAIQTLLGLDPQTDGKPIQHHIEEWLQMAFSPLVMLFPFNIPGMPYSRTLRSSEVIERDILAMIAQKRPSAADSNDVLAMLIQARDEDGSGLTDAELIGETMILFFAGHETTASALTWTLLLLEQHPRVLSDLLDELEGTLHGDAPTLEQLPRLTLLDAVIKESMRLFPPAIFGLRFSTDSFELGPYTLPKGTGLIYSPAITHRLPHLYPQPDRFLPERWANFTPSHYDYIPFGGGPRRCIGAEFALMELKLVLPLILQRYRLSIPPGTHLKRAGMLLSAPQPGLPMQINVQDRRFAKSDLRGDIHKLVDLA